MTDHDHFSSILVDADSVVAAISDPFAACRCGTTKTASNVCQAAILESAPHLPLKHCENRLTIAFSPPRHSENRLRKGDEVDEDGEFEREGEGEREREKGTSSNPSGIPEIATAHCEYILL